jgi:hypothetical protein
LLAQDRVGQYRDRRRCRRTRIAWFCERWRWVGSYKMCYVNYNGGKYVENPQRVIHAGFPRPYPGAQPCRLQLWQELPTASFATQRF